MTSPWSGLSMKKVLPENFSPKKSLAFQVNSAYLIQLLIQHIFTSISYTPALKEAAV